MDPNATLYTALNAARNIIKAIDATSHEEDIDANALEHDASDLAEALIALDEWITKGGFVPERWAR
jgi:hypothetical protein